MDDKLLKNFYPAVSKELLCLGLVAVNKPNFYRNLTTDCFKVRMGNINQMLDIQSYTKIDVMEEFTRMVSREMTTEFADIIFGLGSDNEDHLTERMFFIDDILSDFKGSGTYRKYVLEELRKAGKGFKNCLILSDDHSKYMFIDQLCAEIGTEYTTEQLCGISLYDKGMKYIMLQDLYIKHSNTNHPDKSKLLFVFYNNILGSITYNINQNECYEVGSDTFNSKMIFNFYYELDIAKHKTITVEVP